MITNLYVVYDSKAKCYNKPFNLINNAVAMRSAQQIIKDGTSDIAKSPNDYTMFRIGIYEDTTAVIELLKTHEVVCRFHEVRTDETNIPNQPSLTKVIT